MALKRATLKAMGLTDEQVSSIIEMHTETVDGLKAELTKAKSDADKLPSVQKELDDLKAAGNDGWKEKYDALKKDFDAHKAAQTAKESRAAKEKAVRAYFEGKNIEGKNLTIAMRSSGAEIDALELDGDKIKDTAALDALISGDLAGLVTQTTTTGTQTATPPANNGGGGVTKREIMNIKDYRERQSMIEQHPELFTSK